MSSSWPTQAALHSLALLLLSPHCYVIPGIRGSRSCGVNHLPASRHSLPPPAPASPLSRPEQAPTPGANPLHAPAAAPPLARHTCQQQTPTPACHPRDGCSRDAHLQITLASQPCTVRFVKRCPIHLPISQSGKVCTANVCTSKTHKACLHWCCPGEGSIACTIRFVTRCPVQQRTSHWRT